ncbi:MAG: peptidase MA family metallohydrolase [Clostridium sp.]
MRVKMGIIMLILCLSLFGCSEDPKTIKLRQESDHFNYYSTKTDKESLDDLKEQLESNYERISKDLQVTLDEKIKVTIYPNIGDFHKAIGMENAEDWLVGMARNNEILMVSPLNPGSVHTYETLMKVIVHEYTHILVGNINYNTDVYLNEGIAVFEANQIDDNTKYYLKEAIRLNKLPSIDEMKKNYSGLEQPYIVSGGFVDFIINDYGYDIIIKLIENPDDIELITGETKEELVAKWKEYILTR